MRKALFLAAVLLVSAASTTFGQTAPVTFPSNAPVALAELNGQIMADQQSGATADVKLNNCITAAIAVSPHICNATGLGGTQTIAAQVNVGDHAQDPVWLILPDDATWTATITDGTSCAIEQYSYATITGPGAGGANAMIIQAASTANMNSLYCTEASPTGGGSYVRAEGFEIFNPSGATFASAAVTVQKTFDNSKFSDLVIASYNGTGLKIYGVCCGTSFQNVTINSNYGSGGANALPVDITFDVNGGESALSFYNFSVDHPGAAKNNILITGSVANLISPTLQFYNFYMEGNSTDTTTALVEITGALRASFFGVSAQRRASASIAYVFDVTNSNFATLFQVYGFSFYNDNGTFATGNVVNDHTSGRSILADSNGNLASYSTGTFTISGLAAAISAKSAAYTLSSFDSWVNVTGTTTITVPRTLVGQVWNVFNSGAGGVTVQCSAGNINGAASIALGPNAGRTITTDGTNCFAH